MFNSFVLFDFVEDDHDGATECIEFLVEDVEDPLLRVAGGTDAVFVLAFTKFVDEGDSDLVGRGEILTADPDGREIDIVVLGSVVLEMGQHKLRCDGLPCSRLAVQKDVRCRTVIDDRLEGSLIFFEFLVPFTDILGLI